MTNPFANRKEGSKARKKDRQYNRLLIDAVNRIVLEMECRNISQTKLSHELNKQKSQLSRILSAENNITFRTYSDIAFALGLVPHVGFEEPQEVTMKTPENVRSFISPDTQERLTETSTPRSAIHG